MEMLRNMAIPMIEKELKSNGEIDLKKYITETVNKLVAFLEKEINEQEKLDFIEQLYFDVKPSSRTGSLLVSKNDFHHKPWLKNKKEHINFKYWKRYKKYLINNKKWSIQVVNKLDESTDRILEVIEDPTEKGRDFDRRGLAFGYVQSGKTAHFTGLINKAVDSGYKIIIVLAGMHNDLRSQTQMRLDEEFLGMESSAEHATKQKLEINRIGVGNLMGEDFFEVHPITNRSENGDFSLKTPLNLDSTCLLVVKKNKSVLEKLYKAIMNSPKVTKIKDEENNQEKKIIQNVPLLIVDDEADQASVDTANIYDEDGKILEEYNPKTINRLIRQIYHSFTQRVYVGYTATPFANVLINQEAATQDYGFDLFPRDFIVNLPKSTNYVGPREYFLTENDREELPLYKKIQYHDYFVPVDHKKDFVPQELPESLVKAIYSFILGIAIRRQRGQRNVHNSMLIHVTRLKDVQNLVKDLVVNKVAEIVDDLENGNNAGDHYLAIKKLYDEEYNAKELSEIQNLFPNHFDKKYLTTWEKVDAELVKSAKSMFVKSINGNSVDSLEYEDYKKTGLNVIAIGGDKLSRGLTLEGLIVSYYLRASKMYDTLMQMGRWFGYRQNYLDVCRLYTTDELVNWFGHVAIATEELRAQLDYMSEIGAEPKEFLLRLRSHRNMSITSALKMRAAKDLKVNYSNEMIQTTVFPQNDIDFYKDNYAATKKLIENISSNELNPEVDMRIAKMKASHYYWTKIKAEHIIDFLNEYRTASSAISVDSPSIAKYIEKLNAADELTNWTVVLINTGTGVNEFTEKLTLKDGIRRSGIKKNENSKLQSIKTLVSKDHDFFDFSEEQYNEAQDIILANKEKSISGIQDESNISTSLKTRRLRSVKQGLLVIYPFNHSVIEKSFTFDNQSKPIAIMMAFPETKLEDIDVDYVVNESVQGV